MALAYLVDPENQFMTKAGTINVEGYLRVYDAATDDPAVTYCDFVGTENPEKIILDNNGRAVVIADSDRAYRLEVYNRSGTLLWTTTPLWCRATGGGVQGTELISTDGSIAIDKTTVGSLTTFDLSIATDAKDMLEWVTAERQANVDGALVPFYVDGTMEIVNSDGLFLQANELYHVTNSFNVTPTGAGIAYDTLTVKLMLDSTELCSRSFDIDSSLTDPVECEFSYDVSTTADGYLYWIVSGTSAFAQTMAKMQVHRIYSGIAAVPSTYATKAYVDSGLSSKISYSAIEYNTASQITGISGSAIATTNVDPTEYVPWSASGAFQPSGNYVSADDFSACCSAMSGYVSAIYSDVSSLSSTVSGLSADMSSYVPVSAIEGDGGQVTGISGSAIRGHEYSGVWPVIVDNTADTISVEDKTLAVDETMTGYESAGSAVIGVNTATVLSGLSAYAYESSLSSKLDASASGDFYPFSGNPSGFLTAHQSLAGLATESYVDSSVSSKLDATASSLFITALPADLATTSDVASAVSGKMDLSASSSFYPMTSNPSGYLTAHQSLAGLATEEYVDSAVSGKVDTSAYDSAWFAPASGMSAYAYESSLSSKLDATASSMFQLSGNYQPSGDYAFNSALTAYQPVSGMSAYAPSGDYADNSALDSKLDASASSEFYPADNPSGFVTDLSDYQLTADMSAYQLSGDYAYNSSLADYQPASAMTAYQPSGDYAYTSALADYQPVSAMSAYQPSGDYADASSLSAKMDASASSEYYPMTGNPSGFVTDLSDYQLTADMSGYIPTSESANYQQSSAMTAYQEISGMTAYQPVGTYIYESALGWAEV